MRGYVKMARTPDDDPDAMQKVAEPVIVSAVEAEMGKRSLKFTSDAPDVLVTYYLLLTLGTNAQTIGQFLKRHTVGRPAIFGVHAVDRDGEPRLAGSGFHLEERRHLAWVWHRPISRSIPT